MLLFILLLFFAFASFALSASLKLLRLLLKEGGNDLPEVHTLFMYKRAQALFPSISPFEILLSFFSISKRIVHSALTFALAAAFFYLYFTTSFSLLFLILGLIVLSGLLFVVNDYLGSKTGEHFPRFSLKVLLPSASLLLLLLLPLCYPLFKLLSAFPEFWFDYLPLGEKGKQKIIDLLHETSPDKELSQHDKRLLGSVFLFKESIAREVMVPRVDVFFLEAETSIEAAAALLMTEGYSRIPVYRGSVDNISGVLMYKDLLNKYMEYAQKGNDPTILAAPIESIQKGVLYTPETKKISLLLQEFKKKQVHLAIVVDEYGGTEGIVSIEDILEEIVGEISDEYDEAESLYEKSGEGAFKIDAKMSISDVETELGIHIPEGSDYDTVGGYIFHLTGTIPKEGFIIDGDAFQIEVLHSSDRCVEEVRIVKT